MAFARAVAIQIFSFGIPEYFQMYVNIRNEFHINISQFLTSATKLAIQGSEINTLC